MEGVEVVQRLWPDQCARKRKQEVGGRTHHVLSGNQVINELLSIKLWFFNVILTRLSLSDV